MTKKTLRRLIKVQVVVTLALMAISNLHAKEYRINKYSATEQKVKITTIEQLKDETKINFEVTGPYNVCLFPPGHVNAFYATDVRKTKKWYLLDTLDSPLCPKRVKINQGEKITFSILLEKIDVNRFHVIEGEQQSGMIDWHFPNIKLEN